MRAHMLASCLQGGTWNIWLAESQRRPIKYVQLKREPIKLFEPIRTFTRKAGKGLVLVQVNNIHATIHWAIHPVNEACFIA